MKEVPLVSILVVSFNHSNFIEQAISSLVAQRTNFNFEIIVGDDASRDGTRQKLLDLKFKFNEVNITLLLNKKNLGPFKNTFRNVYPKLTGRYIAICEGDDFWTDFDKLQKQVDFLENNLNYSACYHSAMVVDENNITIRDSKWPYYKTHSQEDLYYCRGEMITNTVMFRNKIPYQKFVEGISNYDTLLWHLIGEHGGAKFMENIQPSAYRIHSGGSWSSTGSRYRLFEAIKTYDYIAKNIRSQNKSDLPIHDKLQQLLHQYLFDSLSSRNIIEYLRVLFSALSKLNTFKQGFLFKHFKALLKRNRKLV